MWQPRQSAPREPSGWKWCVAAAYFSAEWQPRHTWLPGARSLAVCGSWQSEHVTPRWYILLCRNEPYSYTSSRICPSG